MGAGQRALERLLSDEGRAQRVAEAVGAAQGAKARFDATQRTVMHQLNLATRADFKALGRSLGALKKRLLRLDQRLAEQVSRGGDPRR
jgi:hypothetical protein